MGKEFPLARQEEEGRSVLLASTSSGESLTAASYRNERAEKTTPSEVSNGGTVEDTKAKSQDSSKAERTHASSSKHQRRRQHHKNRKSGSRDEGTHKPARRSAKDLGIVYPGSYCNSDKATPHYWTDTDTVDGGVLFQCKFCRIYLWLPLCYEDFVRLCNLIVTQGKDEGYCEYLDKHRTAKVLIAKLQDLGKLSTGEVNSREFARLADNILGDREYDRGE